MTFIDELNHVSTRLDVALQHQKLPSCVQPDYLEEAVKAYPARGGKRLRPALCAWFCGAAGGDPEKTTRIGLAIELYHNWTLIHDDIIDDDVLRRGGKTSHVMLGEAGLRLGMVDDEAARVFGRNMAI
ncbi:MAG: polyprenyl synthetase family protein, partial [Candidatus Pacebacteria bacterium]|nr:polyprenyl synthetase family protein [Candidatus Paceibacterota bacterium]